MSYSQQRLQEQLAEIAAGRRAEVDEHLARTVLVNNERDRERRDKAEQEVNRNIARQTTALRNANEIHRKTLEVNEISVSLERDRRRQEAKHHDEIASLERKRAEEQRTTNQKLLHETEECKKAAHAHQRRMEALEHAKLHEQRLQGSPTYSAVFKLKTLRDLQKAIQEHDEIVATLTPVNLMFSKFEVAANSSDQFHADKLVAAQLAASEEIARQRAAAEVANREAETLKQKVVILRGEFNAHAVTINPLSWFGETAKRRDKLLEEFTSATNQLEKFETDSGRPVLAGLSRYSSSGLAPNVNQSISNRRANVLTLAKSFALNDFVIQVDQKVEEWFRSAHRSEGISAFWGRVSQVQSTEIDYALCLALDNAHSEGIPDAAYPGFGPLPKGRDLLELALRTDTMQRAAKHLIGFDGPSGLLEQLTILREAARTGAYPGEPKPVEIHSEQGTDSDDNDVLDGDAECNEVDPMYDQAVEVVLKNRPASHCCSAT